MRQEDTTVDSISTDHPQSLQFSIDRLRLIISNALSLLTSDVLNRGTTFVIYALVGRHLGAYEFGQLSLALTFLYIFGIFSIAGLKTLIIREVANDRSQLDRYLVNGSLVVIVTSVLTFIVLVLFVKLMNYSPDTSVIIFLVSLGLLPYSLVAVCEGIFQAWEKMHYVAYANIPVNIAKVSAAFLLLSYGYGLYHLVILIMVSFVAIACIEWWLILRYITRPRVKIDIGFSIAMVRTTSTFLGIDGIIAIRSNLFIILLSKLTNETAVGLYSAGAQILVPLGLISKSIALSIFPMMCRNYESNVRNLKQIAEKMVGVFLVAALPAIAGLSILAEAIILLLYGDHDFLLAATVLRIIVWTLVLRAVIDVLGQVLWASRRETISLKIVTINTLVTIVVGVLFISQLGLVGAALGSILVEIINFFQHYMPVSRRLFSGIALGHLIWKPALATLFMTMFLLLIGEHPLFLRIISGGTIYAFALLALDIWSSGGPRRFRAKYQYLQSK